MLAVPRTVGADNLPRCSIGSGDALERYLRAVREPTSNERERSSRNFIWWKAGSSPFVVRLLLSSVIRLTLSRLPSALRWRIWATCGCAAARSSCACRVQPKPLFRLLWCRRRLWTLARQSGRNLIQLKGGGGRRRLSRLRTHTNWKRRLI